MLERLLLWGLFLSCFLMLGAESAEASLDRIQKLSSDWDFYWMQELEPTETLPPPDLVVPTRPWNGLVLPSGEVVGPFGVATYVQDLPELRSGEPYVFLVRGVSTAAKVFIYPVGHPEAAIAQELGKVARGVSQSTKKTLRLHFRPSYAGPYRVHIQIANHKIYRGGLSTPPEIGPEANINNALSMSQVGNLIALGISCSVAAYSFLSWRRERENLSAYYLFWVTVGGSLRNLGTSSFLIDLLPNEADEIIRRIEYGSIPLGFVYLRFLTESFGMNRTERWFRDVISYWSSLLIVLTVFLDNLIFTRFLWLYQLTILVIGFACLKIIIRAVREQRGGAQLIFASVVLILATVLHDIVAVSLLSLHGFFIVPLGIAVFLILQSQLVTQKAAEDHAKAQYLLEERELIQKELRLEVESRFLLASEIAHRLNNPLNYISVSSAQLRRRMEELADEILPLIEEGARQDPEVDVLLRHFRERFVQIFAPFRELDEGLRLATMSVVEIRSLSGIDGHNLQYLPLKQCLLQIIKSYRAESSGERPKLSLRPLRPDLYAYVDFALLERALHLTFSLDPEFPHQADAWSLTLVEEADSPLLGVILAWRPLRVASLEECERREQQANHLLKAAHAKIKVHRKGVEFLIEMLLPRQVVERASAAKDETQAKPERKLG